MRIHYTNFEIEVAEMGDAGAIVNLVRAALTSGRAADGNTPPITPGPEPVNELRSLPSAEQVPFRIAPEGVGAAVGGRRKQAAAIAAPASPATQRNGKQPAQPGDDSIRGKILGALLKRPLSSIELTQATGFGMAQVAPACAQLKLKGRLESKIHEDGDGTRRWFLVKL